MNKNNKQIAKENYYWSWDQKSDKLAITFITSDFTRMAVALTSYHPKNLDVRINKGGLLAPSRESVYKACVEGRLIPFTEEDITNYSTFAGALRDFCYPVERVGEIVFNATAVARFHKNCQLVDGLFRKFGVIDRLYDDLITNAFIPRNALDPNSEGNAINLLVVSKDEEHKTCIAVCLDNFERFQQFSYIKISYDYMLTMSAIMRNKDLIKTLNIA